MKIIKKGIFRDALVFGTIMLLVGTGMLPLAGSTSNEKNLTQEKISSLLDTGGEEFIFVNNCNIEGPWDGSYEYPYKSIMQSIENASEDNIIFVYKGCGPYKEKLFIDFPIHLIGEPVERDNYEYPQIFYDEIGSDYVIKINSDDVEIEGFNIVGNFDFNIGIIIVEKFERNVIAHCVITDCKVGIELNTGCFHNKINQNKIYNCKDNGVLLDGYNNHNGATSITNNKFRDIKFSKDSVAIQVVNSADNYISGNWIKDCWRGIKITGEVAKVGNNLIDDNVFDGCNTVDILLSNAGFRNTIIANDFLNSNEEVIIENTVRTSFARNYWENRLNDYKPIPLVPGEFMYILNGRFYGLISIINIDWYSRGTANVPHYDPNWE